MYQDDEIIQLIFNAVYLYACMYVCMYKKYLAIKQYCSMYVCMYVCMYKKYLEIKQYCSMYVCMYVCNAGIREVSRLEASRPAIFQAVRLGFAAAYDNLVEDPALIVSMNCMYVCMYV